VGDWILKLFKSQLGWYTRGRFSGIKNGYFLNTNEERITKKKIEREAHCSLSRYSFLKKGFSKVFFKFV